MAVKFLVVAGLCVGLLPLAACKPSYSPDAYDSGAVQKANAVDQGVIVGVRAVGVTNDGTTGALTGAAAGGIAGSALPGSGATQALGALGGGLIGSLVGRSSEKITGATTAYEYIVRKSDDKLISVTQQDVTSLPIGQHVLVIAGTQARIVPDYTVNLPEPPKPEKIEPVPTPAPIVVSPIPPLLEPAVATRPAAPAATPAPTPAPVPTPGPALAPAPMITPG